MTNEAEHTAAEAVLAKTCVTNQRKTTQLFDIDPSMVYLPQLDSGIRATKLIWIERWKPIELQQLFEIPFLKPAVQLQCAAMRDPTLLITGKSKGRKVKVKTQECLPRFSLLPAVI